MINLLVALQAEAKPLIRHFALKGLAPVAGFRRYGNGNITLLVTGVGSVAMAAGTMALGLAANKAAGQVAETSSGQTIDRPERLHGWINIGIAGHKNLPVGTPVLAGKITDHASGLGWYPPQVLNTGVEVVTLLTVARPVTDYPETTIVEMEASGYFVTACRFSVAEFVHCFKVVSDNEETSADRLTADLVSELVASATGALDALVGELSTQLAGDADHLVELPELALFLQRFRFSRTQQHQLVRLLSDHRLLCKQAATVESFIDVRRATELLAALDTRLAVERRRYLLPS